MIGQCVIRSDLTQEMVSTNNVAIDGYYDSMSITSGCLSWNWILADKCEDP